MTYTQLNTAEKTALKGVNAQPKQLYYYVNEENGTRKLYLYDSPLGHGTSIIGWINLDGKGSAPVS